MRIHSNTQSSIDASLTGIGAFCAYRVYHANIPAAYKGILCIVYYEMLNIMVAFRIWGHLWKDEKIRVNCDNKSVVNVLNNGRSRDPFLSTCYLSVLKRYFAVYNLNSASVEHRLIRMAVRAVAYNAPVSVKVISVLTIDNLKALIQAAHCLSDLPLCTML